MAASTKKKKSTASTGAQRKNTAKRGTSKKSASRSSAPKYTKQQILLRQSLYIAMAFAALFLLVSALFDVTGIAGRFFKSVMLGFLGWGGYLLPVAILVHALFGVSTKPGNREMYRKAISLYALVILISAMSNMVVIESIPAEGLWSFYYDGGQTLQTGGVVGGFLCRALTPLLGNIGAGLVLALLFIIGFMMLSGLTLEKLFRYFFPEPDEVEEPIAEDIKDEMTIADMVEERRLARAARRRRFNIDLPLGDAEENQPEEIPTLPEDEPPELIEIGDIDLDFAQELADEPEPILDTLEINIPSFSVQTPPQPISEAVPIPTPMPEAAQPEKADEPKEENGKEYTWESTQQKIIYNYPPIDLLTKGKEQTDVNLPNTLRENAKKITETLKSFGVDAKVINVSPGPAVTRYELSPAPGVKVSKITGLADDIALNLAAAGVRIEAPIPGKAAVGLEVPNAKTSMVYIRDIIDSQEFRAAKSDVSVTLGKDVSGQVIVADISKMPHVLIAGATGSGKSVCINTILTSILYKSPPEKVRLLMVDPKVVELGVYNGIPHLLVPVVTDPKKAAGSLNWAVTEMLNRYKLFADKNVRDIKGYNQLCEMEGDLEPLPHIVIVIDELADLMMVAPNEVEDAICRLAQMARAAGMHLVIATQRPSVDVITGTIKANIPSRIAFAVSSQVDSRTILDMSGAEKLLGRGDMLYYPVGAAKPLRVQGCFISDKEVEAVTTFVKNGGAADYDDKVIQEIERQSVNTKGTKKSEQNRDSGDEMLSAAVEVILDAGLASVSLLQRKLKLGYARAARIVDEMEESGFVGPFEGAKPRQVLITRAQWQELQMRSDDISAPPEPSV